MEFTPFEDKTLRLLDHNDNSDASETWSEEANCLGKSNVAIRISSGDE